MTTELTGVVSHVCPEPERRYGFIERPGQAERIYFHESSLTGDLSLDDETLRYRRVRFDCVRSDRGPKAFKVRPAD